MTGALKIRRAALVAAAMTSVSLTAAAAFAADASPNVSMRIITFGETRQQLQSTPIEQRPYRPLHFYGNRVRRQNNRGSTSSTRATRTSSSNRSRSR